MRAPAFWRDDGVTARLLSPLGALYGGIARQRLAREAPRANLPTVVVGGLTAGGDGKTPLAIAVARRLKAAGERPALLTRGYRRRRGGTSSFSVDVTRHGADDVGDEALLLAQVARRLSAQIDLRAQTLAERLGATVVILDDGFHSRRVTPDLTLIAIDCDYGAGNSRCMPAGPLRAPLDAQLAAADMLVVIGDGARGRDIAAARRQTYYRRAFGARRECSRSDARRARRRFRRHRAAREILQLVGGIRRRSRGAGLIRRSPPNSRKEITRRYRSCGTSKARGSSRRKRMRRQNGRSACDARRRYVARHSRFR